MVKNMKKIIILLVIISFLNITAFAAPLVAKSTLTTTNDETRYSVFTVWEIQSKSAALSKTTVL